MGEPRAGNWVDAGGGRPSATPTTGLQAPRGGAHTPVQLQSRAPLLLRLVEEGRLPPPSQPPCGLKVYGACSLRSLWRGCPLGLPPLPACEASPAALTSPAPRGLFLPQEPKPLTLSTSASASLHLGHQPSPVGAPWRHTPPRHPPAHTGPQARARLLGVPQPRPHTPGIPPQPDHRPDMTWRHAAATGGTGSG